MAGTTATPSPSGGSVRGQIVLVIAVTLLSALAGYGAGLFIAPTVVPPTAHPDTATPDAHAPAPPDDKQARVTASTVIDLDPIVTNIAAPADTWIRLELAVEFDGAPADALVSDIGEDLLAYVRTVSLDEVAGPSGFLHFRSEMAARAALRSDGMATAVRVKVMLFE